MRKNIQHIAALACMAMSLACCTKPNWTSGNAVRFGAGTKGENLTKTSYGEIVDGSPRKQMIDWQAGDMIRIACAQASTAEGAPVIADYVTTDGIRYGTSAESRATLSLAGHNDKGLRWGSETQAHVFYAVYPSPHIKSGDQLTDDGSGILTGTIPEDQPAGTISAGTETGSYVAACDMKNQYLVARKTVAAGKQSFGEEEVYLYFTPVTTAIEFEVKNVTGAALDIRNIEILSANHNLSGTFTADLEELSDNGGVYPAVTVASGNRKTAHVSFGDGYALAENNTLTFTVFLFPESDKESTAELNEAVLDDLTFRINKTDNTWIQTALKSDASTWITFDRCKKHFVKGLLAQEGVKWTMEFTSQVQPWALGDDTGSAEIYDQNSYVFKVNGSPDWSGIMFGNTTESQTKGLTVMSYTAQKDDDSQKEAVPFDAAYSLDGGETWSSFDASSTGSAINGLYGIAGTGNAGSIEGLEYGLTAQSRTPSQPGSHEYWTGGHGDWSPSDWSSKDVMYLNRYNFRSDGHEFSQNTANCYIIRHAGKYCIPMVYGNGQLNGSNNKRAFWFGSQDTGALPTCLNYIGQPITSPIIAEDLGIVDPENSHSQVDATLGRFSAAVLWSDVSGVITDVRVAADSDFAWNGYYHKIHGIFFTVDPEKVCQCNAVIAVKDASGQVVWSWHIWITNDPGIGNPTYETVKENGRVFDYFPIPALGFRNGAVYFGRPSMLLKLRQQRSGREIVYLVSQKDVEGSASVLYYQHGRKDPFRASAAFVSMPGIGNDVVNATKEPASLYSGWTDGGYSNLWSGAYSTPGSYVECQEEMRKTIYDPSPKGFRVPVQPAYSPFMIDKVLGNFMKGYYFKLSADDKEGIFFGAYGYKGSGSSVTDNEAAGHYWTAIPETSFYGGTFEFNSEAASLPVNIPLSAACPVRPVTDPDYKQ